jgi:hypothetical protein
MVVFFYAPNYRPRTFDILKQVCSEVRWALLPVDQRHRWQARSIVASSQGAAASVCHGDVAS